MAEHGRRAAGTTSPWKIRESAGRELGRIRRVIAEQAVEGRLPDAQMVAAYRVVHERFESAHAEWVQSRADSVPPRPVERAQL